VLLKLYMGADKSLARPGRKQTTATNLGIYSSYSPQSSILFLVHCSNFCKLLTKNSESCPSNQVSASDEKWWNLNYFFQSREQVVVRRGQIRRIGWVIKTLEDQAGQFLLGCKCPMTRGIVVQEQDHLAELPAADFLQNVLQLNQQRCITLRVDSLALWNKINGRMPPWSQKIEARNFPADFCTRKFLGAGWAAMPPLHWLLLCLQVIVI